MPVTHGVAGSSPVRTAKAWSLSFGLLFYSVACSLKYLFITFLAMKRTFLLSVVVTLLAAANAMAATSQKTEAVKRSPVAADSTYFPTGKPFAIILKEEMQLLVYDGDGVELRRYGIACGRNVGDKREPGDMRTPVGMFKVQEILDAHLWSHDFGDGKGVIKGAYGPRFVRLITGHNGIGIHGTHDETSIGTHATEGCIRLRNADALEFATKYAYRGMPVIVMPSTDDIVFDHFPVEDEEANQMNKSASTAGERNSPSDAWCRR